MSTDSRVFVVRVEGVEKHPNADSLSIVNVFQERWDNRLGRVILKLAGEGYLTR